MQPANELVSAIEQRERFFSTAASTGLAFPFVESDAVEVPVIALASSQDGVDFGSPQGELTQLFIALVIPISQPKLSVQLLARLTRLFQTYPALKERLIGQEDSQQLYQAFIEVEEML